MLVQIDCPPSGRASAVPSIMDSPTLARVERARLRHEEGVHTAGHGHQVSQQHQRDREAAAASRLALTQSLTPSGYGSSGSGSGGYPAIKRGLLWQQRDRLFSRWKERYFVLTSDYLQCFRRASGTDHRVTEMGAFLFKVKLADVERVEWMNRRTHSVVALALAAPAGGRVLLRAHDGLEDWFELLEECVHHSKERRRALRMSTPPHHPAQHQHPAPRQDNNNSINSTLDEWLAARHKIPNVYGSGLATDTVSTARGGGGGSGGSSGEDLVRRRERRWMEEPDTWTLQDNADNRLSLLTDIDISSYDGTLEASGPMSPFHRHNDDVYSVSRRGEVESLRGSFRSASVSGPRVPSSSQVPPVVYPSHLDTSPQLIKFRERSHSDIQRIDRRPWRLRAEVERRAIYN